LEALRRRASLLKPARRSDRAIRTTSRRACPRAGSAGWLQPPDGRGFCPDRALDVVPIGERDRGGSERDAGAATAVRRPRASRAGPSSSTRFLRISTQRSPEELAAHCTPDSTSTRVMPLPEGTGRGSAGCPGSQSRRYCRPGLPAERGQDAAGDRDMGGAVEERASEDPTTSLPPVLDDHSARARL
jgi:hypothetical protein